MSSPTNHHEFVQDTESTVFSAPSPPADKTPRRSHMVRNSLLILLVVAVLAAGTFAVIRLIPPRQTESPAPDLAIPVVSNKVEDIAAFTLTNTHGTLRCVSELQDGRLLWSLEGVENDLINSAFINSTANALASLTALRQMSDTAADYGFDDPRITVSVEGRNGLSSYTLMIGSEAPDKSGSYVRLQDHAEVYLVDQAVITKFAVKDVDFSAVTAFYALKQTADIAGYFLNGTLVTCDSITLTNRNLTAPLVLVPNDSQTESREFITFLVQSPVRRLANNADSLFRFASSDTVCAGVYCFHPTQEDLQRYGFDDPLASLSIQVGSVTRTIMVAPAPADEDPYGVPCYAAVDESCRAIYKIPVSTLTFADASAATYFNKYLTLQMLNSLSGFLVQTPEKTYSFDIAYDKAADSGKDFTIKIGGQQIDQANFQSFYQFFVGLETVTYETEDLDTVPPAVTVCLKHTNTELPDTVMLFRPLAAERRYQVEVDGNRLGVVSAQLLEEFTDYAELVANNKDITR